MTSSIHSDVPPRNISDARITIRYLRTWIKSLLVPELIFATAIGQFIDARSLRAACNAGGLALQTQDEWIYAVRPREDMVAFIQAGTISNSDFRERYRGLRQSRWVCESIYRPPVNLVSMQHHSKMGISSTAYPPLN